MFYLTIVEQFWNLCLDWLQKAFAAINIMYYILINIISTVQNRVATDVLVENTMSKIEFLPQDHTQFYVRRVWVYLLRGLIYKASWFS